ncbi:PAS domain S-box protein [bacterium]|nr:PAS domain S-box protein [bacterium]
MNYQEMTRAELIEALETTPWEKNEEESPDELRRTLHDLRVHQIELEMQNRELREKEAELEASHSRYADLYDFAPTGYVTLDVKGHIVEMNLTCAALLGRERAYLPGNPFTVFVARGQKGRFLKYLRRCQESGAKTTIELRLTGSGGREIYAELQGRPVEVEAGMVILTAVIDISERKRAEAAQEAREYAENIVETVPEPLLVLDADLRVISANCAFYRTFRVPPEETQGQSLYDLGKRAWNIPALRQLMEAVLPHTSFDDFEMAHDFPHLGRRTILLNARPVYRRGEKAELILLGMQDITERQQAEEALKKSRQELQNLSTHLQNAREEERTHIAREIHDELGQALSILQIDLAWLEDRIPNNRKPLFEKIESMSGLINMTIRQIQSLSRELRPSVLDNLGLTTAIEWQTEEFQKHTGIKCQLNMREEIEVAQNTSTNLFRILHL